MHGAEDLHVPARVQPKARGNAFAHQGAHGGQGIFRVFPGDEKEIRCAVGAIRQGHVALVDAVGIDHNAAFPGLAKNLRQTHHMDDSGGDEIGEHAAGTNGGQLVHVADENQPGGGRKRLQQTVRQRQVHHGELIHDDQVGIQRLPGMAMKGSIMRLELQQSVKSLGFPPGGLGQPARRPPGRGRQPDALLPVLQEAHQGIDEGRLAGARAAGDDQQLALQAPAYRFLLLCCQAQTLALLHPCDGRGRVIGDVFAVLVKQLPHAGGQAHLGLVEGTGEQGIFTLQLFADDGPFGAQPVGGGLHRRGRQVQQLAGGVHKLIEGSVDMPVISEALQGIKDTGFPALRGVCGDAQAPGNGIGGEKTDAVDVPGQLIGVPAHSGDGPLAVAFGDTLGIGCRHPMGLQENHHLPCVAGFLPGVPEAADAHWAKAIHLGQAFRCLVDDVQRVETEACHQPLCHHRSDAGKHAAAQIFFDALPGGGRDAHEGGHLELATPAPVVFPAATQTYHLTGLHPGEVAHGRDRVVRLATGLQAHDAPGVLAAGEDDAFDGSLQLVRCLVLHWQPHGHRSRRLRRRALAMTDTEESDMAAAATMGLRRRPVNGYRAPAATGTARAL